MVKTCTSDWMTLTSVTIGSNGDHEWKKDEILFPHTDYSKLNEVFNQREVHTFQMERCFLLSQTKWIKGTSVGNTVRPSALPYQCWVWSHREYQVEAVWEVSIPQPVIIFSDAQYISDIYQWLQICDFFSFIGIGLMSNTGQLYDTPANTSGW